MKKHNYYCVECESILDFEESAERGSDRSIPVLVCNNEKCRLFEITQEFYDYEDGYNEE